MLTPEQIIGYGKGEPSEHLHQCAIFGWVALTGKKTWPELEFLYAVPNGGDRRASVAASMKAEGVKPGVPDMTLPIPCGSYAGLYLELKKPGRESEKDGGCSKDQVKWIEFLREKHHCVHVVYGWEQGRDALIKYLTEGK